MKQALSFLFLLTLLVACGTPNQVPIPATQGATLAPDTALPNTPASNTTIPSTVAAQAKITAPIVDSPGVVSVWMADEKNGWGITDTQVVRTDDGGVTWYDVTPPNAPALGYSAKGEFIDTMHGWVAASATSDPNSSTLYRTADGGTIWKSFSVPFGFGDLKFIDANNGWMMATLGAGAGSQAIAIFQTGDGGATWNKVFSDDPQQAGSNDTLPLSGIKDGITPFDTKTAWVGGVTYAPGVVYLYKTSDAGNTWALSPVQIPAGYEQAEFETTGPQFTSAMDAYLPVHVSTQNGVMMAIYASHNSGASWAFRSTMIPNGGSMQFVSAKDGFVWNATSFYVTHDSAKTWMTVTPDISFGENFAGMDFVTPMTGFVWTNDANNIRHLYKTTDGGATWITLGK